jgi:hypothetical protein
MRIKNAGIACSGLTNVIYTHYPQEVVQRTSRLVFLELVLFSIAFFSCSLILRPIISLCSRSLPLFAKHRRNSHHLPVYIATLSLSYKRYFFIIIIFGPVLTFPTHLLRKKESPHPSSLGSGPLKDSPKLL